MAVLIILNVLLLSVYLYSLLLAIRDTRKPDVNIKWMLDNGAIKPTKAHDTDAGFDFYALHGITIPARSYAIVDTGVHWQPDALCYMKIESRSGLAVKNGLEKGAGTIDMKYTGEIKVKIRNETDKDYTVRAGDKIAQGVVTMLPKIKDVVVKKLEETDRGDKGFGSSGR